ncbi:TatD family hydrolase [Flavobacterium aquatile]|uniref:Hydrolase TatD n=1 Tax=Flavobacterium aquatile LMG 4008 = ATCC 11947 TaxID=1453498 RepID=A0A095UXT6_9FLAO|nr:TatD family hydrolase [Flavobacterium aquatile]KGD67405.1 hydrolase TatD [Flavobacterium aquatile LMG 4008 = ATCC 11947]OXA66941.1 hydrolase TatD [Flavobacterium aquatile] [Flavobacterium aquatile LMG 4008 = ATCC 11947]GEC78808.1 TatD family hydrolase [Flavobacterium aquatile]
MKFFNLHTHKFTNNSDVLELVNQYPWEFDTTIPNYSIGIHPWYIERLPRELAMTRLESDLKIIDEKLQLKECLALGECGLDKRIEVPMQLQIEVFEKQIALAEKHQKPLVLHLVAAFQELIEIKNRLQISVPIIIHGFSKNQQVANELLKNGFYLSFGKYLLRNPELESVFKSVPNDKFFLETDTIDESLEEVYQLAAKYKNIDKNQLTEIITNNYNTVFGSSKNPII